MQCPRCDAPVATDAEACPRCGRSLAVARLDVLQGEVSERSFPLLPRTYTIGRARGNDLALADPSISKTHARLVIAKDASCIEDLGSRHGTFVDGRPIDAPRVLADGESFVLGPICFRLGITRPPSLLDTQDLTT